MSTRINYTSIINNILDIAEELLKDQETASLTTLIGRAAVRCSTTEGRIRTITNTLVAAGFITIYQGWRGRGRFSAVVRNATEQSSSKSSSSSSSSSTTSSSKLQAVIDQLKQEQESFKTHLKERDQKLEALKKENEDLKTNNEKIHVVQVMRGKKKVRKIQQHFHIKFKRILSLAKARKNILLYGPTGSGKTHICQQVAEALDLPFAFVSCTSGMSEGVLSGRLLPLGDHGKFEYAISEFVNVYENGGVFLLDEVDAADPNVLLIINAALANGRISIPGRTDKPYAERHPDFVCIAAANTIGAGADRQYSGRNKLDASTLDRFMIGKIFIDYDLAVEKELCPNEDLLQWCHKVRQGINDNGLERAMSTRFIKDAYEMVEEHEWTKDELAEAYFSGWREDEVNKVKSYLRNY